MTESTTIVASVRGFATLTIAIRAMRMTPATNAPSLTIDAAETVMRPSAREAV